VWRLPAWQPACSGLLPRGRLDVHPDALNWRFGKMTRKAGIGHWRAHEGRHTAVSIMSSDGTVMDSVFDDEDEESL
jgi:hypothetical protein